MILQGKIISVVGCGGKTSFTRLMAENNQEKKVLISTTTQVLPIIQDNIVLKDSLSACKSHKVRAGIQCLGILNERQKLGALPETLLEEIAKDYDLVLLEADGSKSLPYKGWKDYEPVISPLTQQTIGVVTLGGIGKPADEKLVHRLPEFLELTGLKKGEPITLEAVERMLFGEKGMFHNALGKRAVVVNQVEDDSTEDLAKNWLTELKSKDKKRKYQYYYGSVRENWWKEV